MQKKGSLSLSMNAIVVVILAFVFLGLVLTFTYTLFGKADTLSDNAFGDLEFGKQASSSDPIAISTELTVKRNKQTQYSAEFYNKGTTEATDAKFSIENCINTADGEEVTEDGPSVVSPKKTVEAGNSYKFPIAINENGLSGTRYFCDIVVREADSTDEESVYEKEPITLVVDG